MRKMFAGYTHDSGKKHTFSWGSSQRAAMLHQESVGRHPWGPRHSIAPNRCSYLYKKPWFPWGVAVNRGLDYLSKIQIIDYLSKLGIKTYPYTNGVSVTSINDHYTIDHSSLLGKWNTPRNHGFIPYLHVLGTIQWGCLILGRWDQ